MDPTMIMSNYVAIDIFLVTMSMYLHTHIPHKIYNASTPNSINLFPKCPLILTKIPTILITSRSFNNISPMPSNVFKIFQQSDIPLILQNLLTIPQSHPNNNIPQTNPHYFQCWNLHVVSTFA